MDADALTRLLDDVRGGRVDVDDAVRRLRALPFTEVGDLRIDHHRAIRQGQAEAVYAPGKSPTQLIDAVGALLAGGTAPVVVTRADADQHAELAAAHPDPVATAAPVLRGVATSTLVWRPAPVRSDVSVAVVTAGTSDVPVADECATVLRAAGIEPLRLVDVGVAGLHRLLGEVPRLQAADALVVVAGMEGALASVIGGLTAAPVVAVPTSTGYGAGLDGVTALLAMLASCASGVTVVGIDNGFGAASAVLRHLGPRPADAS